MTRYMISTCAVCGHGLGDDWQPEKICPYCNSRYDLVDGQVDSTNTMVMPSRCNHPSPLFISGSRQLSTESSGSHTVTVCPDCGQFRVFGYRDGAFFDVHFSLPTASLVAAAGKWHTLLSSPTFKLGEPNPQPEPPEPPPAPNSPSSITLTKS